MYSGEERSYAVTPSNRLGSAFLASLLERLESHMVLAIRLSILGAMPGGEVWSINPVWKSDDSVVDFPYSNALAIATAAANVFPTSDFLKVMDNETTITGARCEARTPSGELVALAEYMRSSPIPGEGIMPHPYQTSLVISLRTTTPGPRGRGRLYVPATGAALNGATLRFLGSAQTAFLTAANSYLEALNVAVTSTSALAELSVWSRTYATFAPVTKISVGDVLDVQRRRRDALTENVLQMDYTP